MNALLRPITALGARALGLLEFIGGMGYLFRDTAVAAPRSLLAKRGRRLGWQNLWAQMVRVGMKPVDALKAGTSVDAQLLGLFEKTGSIESGKWADIVAVPGNPVEDIHATEKVTFVMKEGTVFKNAKR